MPKIRLLVQQITDQIRSLYDLSSLLRRPRIADKYIRSVNSKSHSHRTALDQPATLPFMVCFNKLDESHIIEKVLQWRGLTKSGQNFSCEDEAPAQERHGLTTDDIGDILWYCQRLARANTRRREQLQHWADHPYISTHDKPTSGRPLPVLVKPPVKASEIKEESASQVSTLKPASFKFSLAGPESIMSKQSFSTAAVSDVYDTKTNARPRTVYAATNVGQCRSNAVPDPPKTQDGQTTFPCPYCGTTLESSEMQDRQSWKYVESYHALARSLLTSPIGAMYFVISVHTSAHSNIARTPTSYTSVATSGYITNFRFTGASMSVKTAPRHTLAGRKCQHMSRGTMANPSHRRS